MKEDLKPDYGVMVLRSATSKAAQRTQAIQAGRISTICTRKGVHICDCIITTKKAKDLTKEVIALLEVAEFKYLLVYAPAPFADSKEEWESFVDGLRILGVIVKIVRE